MMKKGTYDIILFTSSMELDKAVTKNSPKLAIQMWAKFAAKRPTMAFIDCLGDDSVILLDWVRNNREEFLEICKENNLDRSYNIYALYDMACESKGHSDNEYEDQVYPFCLG